MATTTLKNMINPQVMADMVAAALPSAIRFTPFATVDRTLVASAGNTITVPTWQYIGDAVDVAEGTAAETTVLTATSAQYAVKKAVKAVEITDEAILSGYGDPVGNATAQIAKAIAAKVDEDCYTALKGTTNIQDGSASAISYSAIVDAVDKLNSEALSNTDKVLFIAPAQLTTLRKDENFISQEKYGGNVMMTGEVGMIAGCRVVPSRRITASTKVYTDIIVQMADDEDSLEVPALTIYLKRDVNVENDRDILKKTSVISADEHYVAALTNAAKAVALKAM